MNDLDRLAVMILNLLLHYDSELSARIDNRKRMLDQMPTTDAAFQYLEALAARTEFNDLSNRIRSVLDFFRGDDV